MSCRWRCKKCYRWLIRAMMSIDYLCFVCDREKLKLYIPKNNSIDINDGRERKRERAAPDCNQSYAPAFKKGKYG